MTYLFVLGLTYGVITSFIISKNVSLKLEDQQIVSEISDSTNVSIYKSTSLRLEANTTYRIDLKQDFTSIKLTSKSAANLLLSAGEESYRIGQFVVNDELEVPPNFVIFQSPQRNIDLSSTTDTEVLIELFYAKPIALVRNDKKTKKRGCEEPFSFSSESWRDGLPEPTPGRESTQVNHCIVHHAASSNSDTNYTNVVRNIYLLHTQSNGWDDIGYNYVIAQNGDIYEGRYHENVDETDNIKGAHFCSKNEGTMGVCMLGNYMTQKPSSATISSLKQLLAWKLYKENLQANDSFIHPKNSGSNLGTIAFHQHGCATSCPGDSMVPMLQQLRNEVQQSLDSCLLTVSTKKEKVVQASHRLYPNPSDGRFYCLLDKSVTNPEIRITDRFGRVVFESPIPPNGYINSKLNTGLYIYQVWSDNKLLIKGRLQVNN